MVVVMLGPLGGTAGTVTIVLLTAILIACLKKGTAAFTLFTFRGVVSIGLISYSLYLWHWGALSISRWTIGIHLWSAPFQIALMVVLSVLSYQLFEKPLRVSPWGSNRHTTLFKGFAVLAAASASLIGLNRSSAVVQGIGDKILGRSRH